MNVPQKIVGRLGVADRATTPDGAEPVVSGQAGIPDVELSALIDLRADLDGFISAHSKNRCSQNTLWTRWHFERSIMTWLDGQDIDDLHQNTCDELNVDEDGDPLDEHGQPLRTFNPSRVHPDDLCQSKGYAA